MKFKEALIEGLDDTSWNDSEGKTTITLRQLLKAVENIPVVDFPVSKLKKRLLSWKDNPEEIEKIEKSDLQYPILIFMNDDSSIKTIVDGHHRAQKAVAHNLISVKAKLIKFSSLPIEYREVFE